MEIYVNPSRDQWARLCQRAVQDNEGILSRVREILEQVRQKGDEAIKEEGDAAGDAGRDGLDDAHDRAQEGQ